MMARSTDVYEDADGNVWAFDPRRPGHLVRRQMSGGICQPPDRPIVEAYAVYIAPIGSDGEPVAEWQHLGTAPGLWIDGLTFTLSDRLVGAGPAASPDQSAYAYDPDPDRCWRCDASPARDDLGLCLPCRQGLAPERTKGQPRWTADRADFLDRETAEAPDHDPVALADLLDLPEPTPPRPSDFPVARQRHWQRIAEREARHTDRARIRTLEARLAR